MRLIIVMLTLTAIVWTNLFLGGFLGTTFGGIFGLLLTSRAILGQDAVDLQMQVLAGCVSRPCIDGTLTHDDVGTHLHVHANSRCLTPVGGALTIVTGCSRAGITLEGEVALRIDRVRREVSAYQGR